MAQQNHLKLMSHSLTCMLLKLQCFINDLTGRVGY